MPAGKPVLLYCIFPVVRDGVDEPNVGAGFLFLLSCERSMVDAGAYRGNREKGEGPAVCLVMGEESRM